MKKRFFFFTPFFFLPFQFVSQDRQYIYYLDADLISTEQSRALILGKGVYENGLFKLDCYSIAGDKLFISLHFTDSTLKDMNGPYISYHLNGKPERQGNVINNTEEGAWYKWDSIGRKIDSTIYKEGKAMITATSGYFMDGVLHYHTLKDSLQDTYYSITYDKDGEMTEEVFLKGKRIMKTYTGNAIHQDSLFTREETEASFPGGNWGWSNYLKANLDANVPVDNKAPEGTYQVIIRFVVKTDGSIEDVYAETYFGYGMEKEVIRIIQKGPKWIPALQYGRKVNAYRRQPVTFVVSRE